MILTILAALGLRYETRDGEVLRKTRRHGHGCSEPVMKPSPGRWLSIEFGRVGDDLSVSSKVLVEE